VSDVKPLMYHELAGWFHLLSSPEEYEEEATFYFGAIVDVLGRKPTSWLELGSGGGNNASHYAPWVEGEVVLSDRSPEMLELSKSLNPNLEHVEADMLDIRLGKTFDVVFVHDAAAYLVTPDEVRRLAETAFLHCHPGGVVMFCPDNTAENLDFETDHGGHDGDGKAMRYLEWSSPGRPGTYECITDYVYILHEDGQEPRVLHDRHITGALPRQVWLDALAGAGFVDVQGRSLVHSEVPEDALEVFLARRP